jgi:hypothetical protein
MSADLSLSNTQEDIDTKLVEYAALPLPIPKRKRKPKAQRVADLPVSKEDRRQAILRKMAEMQREFDELEAQS